MADNYPHGLFSWADVSSPDPAAATEFYSALFGWESAEQLDPEGNYIYTMFSIGGKATAGLGPQPEMMKGMPPIWSSYITVDSVDDTVAKATAAGGNVIVPAMDVMESGRMAFVADPGGAVFGLWQPGTHRGADLLLGPGTLAWNDLATGNTDAAEAFYGEVFPWDFKQMPAADASAPMNYWTIHMDTKVPGDGDMDDDFNGGMIAMDENWPAEIPPHWMVYFRVTDTDAAAAKIKELGGNISVEPFDTPAGKIAVVNDPQGGTFSIIAEPKSQ